MDEHNEDKLLDELLRKAVDSGKVEFGAEQWKQKFPDAWKAVVSRQGGSTEPRPNIITLVFRSRFLKLAAAAVIIIAVGVAVVHRRPAEQVEPTRAVKTARSPAKMMSRLSLTLAYNRGGLEAVDEQYKKAFEKLGSKQEILSMAELLNGNGDS